MYYPRFESLKFNLVYILDIFIKKKMIEVVWSVNIMIAILIIGVACVLYYIFTYDQKYSA